MRKVLPVLLNRSSGDSDAREVPDRIREAFRSAGVDADVRIAGDGEQFGALAREAAAGDSAALVAAGGDGSVGSVAAVLAGSGKPLGVLLRATELRIETRGDRARVATDGEISSVSTPLRYRVLPGALAVIVPRETIEEAP